MPRDDYYARQEARKERLERAADRANERAAAAFKRADMREEVTGIPFGQPVLVGHHSEGRHRAAIKRADNAMRTSINEDKKAKRLAGMAAGVGSGGISSDAPDAIELLREKVTELEAQRERMKDANTAWRKAGNKPGRQDDGSWVEPPYPPYSLTNLGARIRDAKARVARLEREGERETKEVETNVGVTLVQNAEANRVQLIFPGKPAPNVIKELKSRGFRWSPSEKAWQRMLNNAGIYAAQCIVNYMTPEAE